MGVGMINTVLFMAVIFCSVWNITTAREEKQGSVSRVRVCIYLFKITPCIPFTLNTLTGEYRLWAVFCREDRCALLQAAGWPPYVCGDHWKLSWELCINLIICISLLWEHLGEQRSLVLLPSVFLPSASLSLSIFGSAQTVGTALQAQKIGADISYLPRVIPHWSWSCLEADATSILLHETLAKVQYETLQYTHSLLEFCTKSNLWYGKIVLATHAAGNSQKNVMSYSGKDIVMGGGRFQQKILEICSSFTSSRSQIWQICSRLLCIKISNLPLKCLKCWMKSCRRFT